MPRYGRRCWPPDGLRSPAFCPCPAHQLRLGPDAHHSERRPLDDGHIHSVDRYSAQTPSLICPHNCPHTRPARCLLASSWLLPPSLFGLPPGQLRLDRASMNQLMPAVRCSHWPRLRPTPRLSPASTQRPLTLCPASGRGFSPPPSPHPIRLHAALASTRPDLECTRPTFAPASLTNAPTHPYTRAHASLTTDPPISTPGPRHPLTSHSPIRTRAHVSLTTPPRAPHSRHPLRPRAPHSRHPFRPRAHAPHTHATRSDLAPTRPTLTPPVPTSRPRVHTRVHTSLASHPPAAPDPGSTPAAPRRIPSFRFRISRPAHPHRHFAGQLLR